MFCSVEFALNLNTNNWPSKFNGDWERRMKLLKDDSKEKGIKIKEFKDDIIPLANKLRNSVKKLADIAKISTICVEILQKKTIDPSLDVYEGNKVNEKEWGNFLIIKDELDDILIKEIRKELLNEIECCFAGHPDRVFKYPKVFYLLNGHYLEEVVYSIFFKNPKYQKAILIGEIVRENGIMNDGGCMVPNELYEILRRIDSFEMPQQDNDQDDE